MLAYRHAFHAGNHADVLKHATLVAVLRHLNAKDKGWRLVDTHAGAGAYALGADAAQKLGEYRQGIARLWSKQGLPPLLADYVEQVRLFNPQGELAAYPGSPCIAKALMRPQDQLRLYELHPTDHTLLSEAFAADRTVQVQRAEGFSGIRAQLPPPTRRGLLLMDPSYELKTDYAAVAAATEEALTRFAEGTVMVWYPQVDLREATHLPVRLKAIANAQARKGWLHARLTVAEPNERGFGMLGSGVFVINPPHTLRAELRAALPVLVQLLGQYAGASQRLELSAAA
jgi:23S rRNA (adenine2030-N6)-methyltransferase